MENQEKTFVISLSMLWAVLRKKFIFILIAAVLVGAGALAVSVTTYTAEYTAKTDVFIINEEYQNLGQQPSSDINTYSLALNVVRDCKEILEGKETKLAIAQRLGMSSEELEDIQIKVNENSAEKSRILNISITSFNPEFSYNLSNAMIVVAQERINDFCSHDVKVVNYAELPTDPSNARISPLVFVAAVFAAVLVYAAFLLQYFLDDRIRSIEDVEKLSLSPLAEIPNAEEPRNSKKYGYYGKRYGGYYSGRYGGYYAAQDELGETKDENS